MRRREVIAFLSVTAAWPFAVHAQQPEPIRRLAVFLAFAENDPEGQLGAAALLQKLKELGWAEGQNLRVDLRFAGSDAERLRASAQELVALTPEVIFARSNPALANVLAVSRRIPVVFIQVADPVGSGFVDNLARPSGNATGFTNFEPSMGGKWLELLKEIAPAVSRAEIILHPETAAHFALLRAAQAAAPALGVTVTASGVHDAGEIERVIAALASEQNVGVIISHVVTTAHRDLIARLAARYRLPTVTAFRFMATSGALVSYGIDPVDVTRRAAVYIDRILRGARIVELPVQAPTRFELVFNLKTANAIGLTIPPSLLSRADEVIE
jgi:putative ABC transport system substrate-binding protein